MAKGHKKDELQNLPACIAEFIRLVIKKMRYRRKVRREVQAELVAHFEDELKDCATEEEKEQKAQQLIAEFGDAKLLAILMRRAKKRCRPLWRTVIARTCQAVVILFVCLVAYVIWFLSGKPVITVNYVAELNRMVRPVADETLNAAPLYHKAAKSVENLPNDMKELMRKNYKQVTAEEKQLIEKWLTDNEETLELVIAGSQKPYYWLEYKTSKEGSSMMGVLVPHLAEFRRLAYSLRWRTQLSAEKGRYEDAFSDIKSCYRFGQHLRGDKTIIEQLVGIAIETLAVQTLRDILDRYQFDSATLTTLQNDFEQMIADEDFTTSIKTEKLFMYDEIQRCFTEDRLGGGHISLEGFRCWQKLMSVGGKDVSDFALLEKFLAKPIHILFTHPNKQETREMADQLYSYWGKVFHKTPGQIRAEGIDVNREGMEIIKGNLLLEILAPAFGRINEISHRNKTELESTLAIIAILRYKHDVGDYPENLEKLIETGYLKAVPIDSFSDKPLVYRTTDDRFILYSLGRNFKDDGGQCFKDRKGRPRLWADNGDAVFWPVPKTE